MTDTPNTCKRCGTAFDHYTKAISERACPVCGEPASYLAETAVGADP